MAAARQAGDHAGRDGAGNLGEATLEQLADHVGRLARAYLTGPMFPLFGELAMIRNRAYELLERTERLSQRRDLYLVAGQLSCLLAGTSCDLGHSAAAIEQARAARTYASGMLSTFFSFEGQHRRALDHARAGLARLGAGHEEYLAALLQHQVADPESTGSIMRIRTTHFPAFMQLRDQRIPECSVAEVVRGDYHGEKTTTTIEPYELAGHRGAMLAIGQRVPNCCHQYFSYDPDDGAGELWFLDPSSGSWASHFHFTPDCTDDEFSIRQHGPRQLWDEVSAAHAWWVEQGRPDDQDWLFTVHPDHQTINLTARHPPRHQRVVQPDRRAPWVGRRTLHVTTPPVHQGTSRGHPIAAEFSIAFRASDHPFWPLTPCCKYVTSSIFLHKRCNCAIAPVAILPHQ